MNCTDLKDKSGNTFDGPLLISPRIFNDSRGYFYETWNKKIFDEIIKSDINFVQDNQSFSTRNTLRGLHYQINPEAQGKFVRATSGEIFDVIVDLRKGSNTFTKWVGVTLNSKNKKQLWIPAGFAHGFLTLSSEAIVEYKVTSFWNKDYDRTLVWNDSSISIEWPLNDINKSPKLSKKDLQAPGLKTIIDKGDIFE